MKKIPIIGEILEQKLIITFKRDADGEGCLSFDFDPPIIKVISPEQHAATSVANHVIALTQLQLPSEKEQKNGKIIVQ